MALAQNSHSGVPLAFKKNSSASMADPKPFLLVVHTPIVSRWQPRGGLNWELPSPWQAGPRAYSGRYAMLWSATAYWFFTVNLYMCIHMHTHKYIYNYTCIHIYIYIRVHTYIHIYTWLLRNEVKQILRSDEEKELVLRHREEQRKLHVKNISETFVKNSFYLLWIRVLQYKIISE